MKYFYLVLMMFSANLMYSQNAEKDFFDVNHISEIKLTIKQSKYENILDSMKIYGEGMIVGDATIDGKILKDVGIRYRGNSSYGFGNKRNPWHIKLDYINKSQQYQGISSIKLSNALRDPSMVREVVGFEIARKYMIAPRCNYTKLYINNKYAGLYVNIESVDKNFIEKNNAGKDNTFFKCSPEVNTVSNPGCKNKVYASLIYEPDANCFLPNYTLLSESGWDELIDLTKTLEQDPVKISNILDVDQTLWMLAFNNVFVNLSSYSGKISQNYYIFKNNFGKFEPVIWDLNLCFGSFKNSGAISKDLDLKQLQELDPLLHIDNTSKPLISKLLSIKEYRLIYLAHIRQLYEDIIISGYLEKRTAEFQKMIRKPYLDDPNKEYSVIDFDKSLTATVGSKSKIPGIMELMEKRLKYLRKNEQLKALPSDILKVEYARRAQFDNNQIQNFKIIAEINNFPKKAIVFYRPKSNMEYKTSFMYDDGTNGDEVAGDNKFTVVIDPLGQFSEIEYYIQTENSGAVGFYPGAYVRQPEKITLAELNK